MEGHHIYSEIGKSGLLRIEVLSAPPDKQNKLWKIPNGIVLIAPIFGCGGIVVDSEEISLKAGDSILLKAGESFYVYSEKESQLISQFIWIPGFEGNE